MNKNVFLSIEEKTFLSLWPTEPSDSLPPPPQQIKINYNVVYMIIIMRDIISTEEQTTSSVKQEKWKRGIFYLSSKYKSDSSGNGKEGEEEGGESTVGHQQGFHLDNWTIRHLDNWTI